MTDEIKQPQGEASTVEQVPVTNTENASSKAKTTIDNGLSQMFAFVAKPWGQVFSTLTFCNKFTVAMLGVFLIAGYLPAVEIFSTTSSLYEQIDVGIFPFMVVVVMAMYALGVKRIVSKLASIALVLFVLYQCYEVYRFFSELSGGRMAIDKRAIQVIAEAVRYGTVVWLVSFVAVAVLSFLPWYKSNEKLWPALKAVINTPSESAIDVEQYTRAMNAGIQSAVSKGQATLKDVDLSAKTKHLSDIKQFDSVKKWFVPSLIVSLLLGVVGMLFTGNSAPSEKEIQAVFDKQGKINLGFVSGAITNVKLNHCDEIEDKAQPTFKCNVDALIEYDLGGLGSLFGRQSVANDELNESFNESFIFIQGSRGWYMQE